MSVGALLLLLRASPTRPRLFTQPCQGALGGTRWAGQAEEGTFLPMCRQAQAGASGSCPRPVGPLLFRRAILAGGGLLLAQVEPCPVPWPWARPVCDQVFLLEQQEGPGLRGCQGP